MKSSNLQPAVTLLRLDYPTLDPKHLREFLEGRLEQPASTQPPAGKLLRIKEVADLCGVTKRTVQTMLKAGTLHRIRLAGKRSVRISAAEVLSLSRG